MSSITVLPGQTLKITGLASGGALVETDAAAPVSPLTPVATMQFDATTQVYSVDGNPATGDNELAGQVASNRYSGMACKVSILQANGAPIPVDVKTQLKGKRVECRILTPAANDAQAVVEAIVTIEELFGGINVVI